MEKYIIILLPCAYLLISNMYIRKDLDYIDELYEKNKFKGQLYKSKIMFYILGLLVMPALLMDEVLKKPLKFNRSTKYGVLFLLLPIFFLITYILI